jgi:hypothetical protein
LQRLHHEADSKQKQAAKLQQQAEGKRIQGARSMATDSDTEKHRRKVYEALINESNAARAQASALQTGAETCLADACAMAEKVEGSRMSHAVLDKKLMLTKEGVSASGDALAACMTISSSLEGLSACKEQVCCCYWLASMDSSLSIGSAQSAKVNAQMDAALVSDVHGTCTEWLLGWDIELSLDWRDQEEPCYIVVVLFLLCAVVKALSYCKKITDCPRKAQSITLCVTQHELKCMGRVSTFRSCFVVQVAALEQQLHAQTLAIADGSAKALKLDDIKGSRHWASSFPAHYTVLGAHELRTRKPGNVSATSLHERINEQAAAASSYLERLLSARQALETATAELCRIETALDMVDRETKYMVSKSSLLQERGRAQAALAAAKGSLSCACAQTRGARQEPDKNDMPRLHPNADATTVRAGMHEGCRSNDFGQRASDNNMHEVDVESLEVAVSKAEDALHGCSEAYEFETSQLELSSALALVDRNLAHNSATQAYEMAFVEGLCAEAEQASHRSEVLQERLSRVAADASQDEGQHTQECTQALQQRVAWMENEAVRLQDRRAALESQLEHADSRLAHLRSSAGQLQSRRALLQEHVEVLQEVRNAGCSRSLDMCLAIHLCPEGCGRLEWYARGCRFKIGHEPLFFDMKMGRPENSLCTFALF